MNGGKDFFHLLAEKGFIVDKPAVMRGLDIPAAHSSDPGARLWAQAALRQEADKVASAALHTRNDTLNKAAYTIGGLVGSGHLDADDAVDALSQAAKQAGLSTIEINRTVTRALGDGARKPRLVHLVPLTEYPPAAVLDHTDLTDVTDVTDVTDHREHEHKSLAAKVEDRLPRLDWEQLWADETDEQWILEPLLAIGRAIVVYSAPKVGKSLLMLEMAAGIATGRRVLGETPTQQRVLYVDFENDPRGDIRTRLQSMGYTWTDLENLVMLSYPVLSALDTEQGGEQLLAAAAHYQCTVIIIDTLSRAVGGEENSNDTYLQFYRHTVLKCKQAGISMIRLDHSGKDVERGMRGASAKESDVDAVWRLTRIDDIQLRLECTHHRMPIPDKELTLLRLPLPHLHHAIDQSGRKVAYEGKIAEVIAALDRLKVPLDAGERPCRAALKQTGVTCRSATLREAVKRRRGTVSVWDQAAGGGVKAT